MSVEYLHHFVHKYVMVVYVITLSGALYAARLLTYALTAVL